MSSVVGVVDNGRLVMGCDSIYVGGGASDNTTSNKLTRRGDFLIGCTFSPRARQVLAYEVALPDTLDGDDLEAALVKQFVKPVRVAMKDAGLDEKKEGSEQQTGHILVGIHNRLFVVEYDWRVIEPRCGYWAVGSDNGLAMGALHATRGMHSLYRRVEIALQAGAAHSVYIRPPFVIEEY